MMRSLGWKPAPPPGQTFLLHAWRHSPDQASGYSHTTKGAQTLETARQAAEELLRAGWEGVEIRQNDG